MLNGNPKSQENQRLTADFLRKRLLRSPRFARRLNARAILHGDYGRDKRLAVTVSTRNTAGYRDPAAIAIDQMKEMYLDGMLEPIETANWFPKVIHRDYPIGVNVSLR